MKLRADSIERPVSLQAWKLWRARHDSNVRPLPSEGSTLSN